VDLFGGLSFADSKDSSNSTNRFVESLKTFSRRLAMSFYRMTLYFTIPLAFELLLILPG